MSYVYSSIFGEKGTMIAILGGSVDLLRDNFISDHFVVKQSKTLNM